MSRTITKGTLAAVAALATLPASALAAAPTITSSPNPTTSGDPVVIYGTAKPGAKVVLYHRVNPAPRFTVIQKTTADTAGRYEFTRADGVVTTNRNWYVKVDGKKSGVTNEKVSAIVTAAGPTTPNLETKTPYVFTGTVSPNHSRERVELQRQVGTGADEVWKTVDTAKIGPNGGYAIKHAFSATGDASLRVHLDADSRNIGSDSDVLSYAISEKQHPDLTINSSVAPLTVGGSTVISGTLAGVSVATPVTLYSHVEGRGFAPVAVVNTDAAGNYSFAPQAPIANTTYQVRGGGKSSAVRFEGVKDAVTAAVSATSVTAGDTLTFTGNVSPDKTGHVVYLERQNAGGKGFHIVQKSKLQAGSAIVIARRVTAPGTKVFRIVVPGGPVNQGGASAPFTITVAANAAPLT